MRTIHKYRDPDVLKKKDKISARRELYIEQHEPAELTVEMDDVAAWVCFNKLPEHVLPVLPAGYSWVRLKDHFALMRHRSAKEHEITMVLYGPDHKNVINFLCCIDGVTTYSFANTRKQKSLKRDYPMSGLDYRVSTYDYTKKRYKCHVRGHLVDHGDTIQKGRGSTYDGRNFVPEPPIYEWGMGFRNVKVAALRKADHETAYAQMNTYGITPMLTQNGTAVPESVRFYTFAGQDHQPKEIYHVKFEQDMERPKGERVLDYADRTMRSSLLAAPVVVPYSPEMTDRTLRYQCRTTVRKEREIVRRATEIRYPELDRQMTAYAASDFEFESAGKQFHAGVLAFKDETPLAHTFFKRSSQYAESLQTLGEKKPIFTSREIEDGQRFFKFDKEGDLEDLSDHFRQIWSV